LIIAVLALVGFVEGYDLAITGSLLVLAKEPLHLTETDIRWIAVGPTLMLCIGGFAFSAVSDHWSRKTVMLVGLQQVGQYRAVGDIGRRSHHRVDQFGAAVDPEMRLHPEIPLVALLRLMHLGSRALSAFLVEDGALMIVASTIVPMVTFSPFARQVPLHLVEQPLAQIVLLEQVTEAAHRRLVRHRLVAKVDPDKTPHRCHTSLSINLGRVPIKRLC